MNDQNKKSDERTAKEAVANMGRRANPVDAIIDVIGDARESEQTTTLKRVAELVINEAERFEAMGRKSAQELRELAESIRTLGPLFPRIALDDEQCTRGTNRRLNRRNQRLEAAFAEAKVIAMHNWSWRGGTFGRALLACDIETLNEKLKVEYECRVKYGDMLESVANALDQVLGNSTRREAGDLVKFESIADEIHEMGKQLMDRGQTIADREYQLKQIANLYQKLIDDANVYDAAIVFCKIDGEQWVANLEAALANSNDSC